MYHELKYNTSIDNPCRNGQCSHLCLIVHKGHRCTCPDSSTPSQKIKADILCDAPIETERPLPKVCKCENGGVCIQSIDENKLDCECMPNFQGEFCEIHVAHSRAGDIANTTAIIVPIVVILLILVAATGVYFFIRKRPL